VKVVRAANGDALYFSRAPVPWDRDRFARERAGTLADGWLRHIGIYAYRAGFLKRFAAMPPGLLERIESLEQLRALEAGARIAIEGLRGRQVVVGDFDAFDLILCADRNNLRQLRAMAPRASWPRLALLLEWAGPGEPAEVPDPYDGSLEDFRDVHGLLEAASE